MALVRADLAKCQAKLVPSCSRRTTVRVSASTPREATRRSLLGGLASGIALLAATRAAEARDFKEALARKEARKAKLRGTAGEMRSSGKDQQVFKSSDYMVSEEARTPNVHSRQGEGAKTQENI